MRGQPVQLHRTLCRYLLLVLFAASAALPQNSTLTQIQDTVNNPSGAPFNGTVVITWTGGSGSGPFNTSVKIANGVLSVQLAPSTNITPVAYYQAVYNSSDGLTTWTETWAIPPSATPLTLAQVRVTNSGGGGGGGGGTGNITISQVVGLSADLSAINSSLTTFNSVTQGLNLLISNLTATVNGLSNTVGNLSGGTTNANFVDAEIPAGSANGTNATFTLKNTPSTSNDLFLYLNGILQINTVDYTLTGSVITFSSNEIPRTGDELLAYYRLAGVGPTASFVDGEIPTGAVNGVNTSFLLAAIPSPASSLKVFKNGILMEQSVDYTLTNNIITFVNTAVTPATGDLLLVTYRIPNTN
jgi:hypothetical protein